MTRTANRANATIYTIDPRGLVAGADLDEQLDPVEFGEHVRKTQDSLRVLADETGGIAVVNQNDFDKALKQIDTETSDYYVLGLLLDQPGSAEADAQDRGEGEEAGTERLVAHVVHAEAAAGAEPEVAQADVQSSTVAKGRRVRRPRCLLTVRVGLAGVR